jgi:hypothetical protein
MTTTERALGGSSEKHDGTAVLSATISGVVADFANTARD